MESGPLRKRSASVPPSTHCITRNGSPEPRMPRWCTVTIPGWEKPTSALVSLLKPALGFRRVNFPVDLLPRRGGRAVCRELCTPRSGRLRRCFRAGRIDPAGACPAGSDR